MRRKNSIKYRKEIKLRPATDVGDYQVKLACNFKFLEEGTKLKLPYVSVVVRWHTNSWFGSIAKN
jgi:translation initiation factor IF-3